MKYEFAAGQTTCTISGRDINGEGRTVSGSHAYPPGWPRGLMKCLHTIAQVGWISGGTNWWYTGSHFADSDASGMELRGASGWRPWPDGEGTDEHHPGAAVTCHREPGQYRNVPGITIDLSVTGQP